MRTFTEYIQTENPELTDKLAEEGILDDIKNFALKTAGKLGSKATGAASHAVEKTAGSIDAVGDAIKNTKQAIKDAATASAKGISSAIASADAASTNLRAKGMIGDMQSNMEKHAQALVSAARFAKKYMAIAKEVGDQKIAEMAPDHAQGGAVRQNVVRFFKAFPELAKS